MLPLILLGCILIVGAYLSPKLYHLRLTAIIGFGFVLLAALFGEAPRELRWAAATLSLMAMAINLYWLLNGKIQSEGSPALGQELAEVHARNFPMLTGDEFLEIYDGAKKKRYQKSDIIIRSGNTIDQLILISKGTADVFTESKLIANLEEGDYIGEMSYFSQSLASGNVKVSSDALEVIIWSHDNLDKLKENTELYNKFMQAIQENIVAKISKQNYKLVDDQADQKPPI